MQSTTQLDIRIKRWIPALLLMGVIFALSSVPASEMPNAGAMDVIFKKGGHMLGYALLSLAYLRGLGGDLRTQRLIAFLLAVGYAATDEIHQSFVPGRGPWVVDIAIDSTGAAIALYLLPVIPAFRRLLAKL